MENRFCQSCGMPMTEESHFGTEMDGRRSEDYCHYCYQNGRFVADCTMEQMIESCIAPMVQENPGMTSDAAREAMRKWFPTLKRWR